jgi:prepilin-type N-terminal cleavage/methylation domain-containing protein
MNTHASRIRQNGFTLVEILIVVGISASVIVALLSVYLSCIRSWHRASLAIETTQEANRCLNQLVYGVGTGMGLRASYTVTNLGSATDWLLRTSNYDGMAWFDYNASKKIVVYSNASGFQVIGTNIIASSVTTTVNSVKITLTVLKTDGQFSGTNTMSTFVKLRTATIR